MKMSRFNFYNGWEKQPSIFVLISIAYDIENKTFLLTIINFSFLLGL